MSAILTTDFAISAMRFFSLGFLFFFSPASSSASGA
jgi:hypothetical protein